MTNKKYCEYPNCYMQLHEHEHKDENTITFAREEIYKQCHIFSIHGSMFDG